MKVTAAIPTIGRTETLPMVLYSLANQLKPIDELIILDEARRPVLENYAVNQAVDLLSLQGIPTKIIRRRHRRGIAQARLDLAQEAKYRHVLMVDDDVALRNTCLGQLTAAWEDRYSWVVPFCFLVSAAFKLDGYTDKKVSKDDPEVTRWTERYPWFVPYFDYKERNFCLEIPVAGTQCILWDKEVLLDHGSEAGQLGPLPREDTYLTKMTGPGLFVSEARCDHFEHAGQEQRSLWGSSMFYRLHEAAMEDPEGFLKLLGKEEVR